MQSEDAGTHMLKNDKETLTNSNNYMNMIARLRQGGCPRETSRAQGREVAPELRLE